MKTVHNPKWNFWGVTASQEKSKRNLGDMLQEFQGDIVQEFCPPK